MVQHTPTAQLIRPVPLSRDLRLIELRGGEIELVRQVFAGLSQRSRWLRFHTGMPLVPERYLAQLALVAPGQRQVVIATVGGEPAGHGEWTRDRDRGHEAEIALAVADRYHGRGVGLALAESLSRSALIEGIEYFRIHALKENAPVRRWLARCATLAGPGDPEERVLAITDLRRALDGPRAHPGSRGIGAAGPALSPCA